MGLDWEWDSSEISFNLSRRTPTIFHPACSPAPAYHCSDSMSNPLRTNGKCVFCSSPEHKSAFCMKKMKEYRRAISMDESLLTLAEPTKSAGSRARHAHHSLEESTSAIAIICFHCGESGHTEEKCINPAPSTADFNCRRHDDGYTHGRYSGRGQNKFLNGRRCRGCAEFGHRMKDCPLLVVREGRGSATTATPQRTVP